MASAKEIPPGGEGKIDVTFKTAGKSGVREQAITVTSNDPYNQTVVVKVKANLEVYFEAKEKMISFGRIPRSDVVSKTISFAGKYLKETAIQSIELKNPDFAKSLTWKINDQRSADPPILSVDFFLNPSTMTIGPFRDSIKVKTSAESSAELEIAFSGEILGPLSTDPARLIFGISENPETMVRPIVIKSTDSKEFSILEASIDDTGLTIEPFEKSKALSHTLKITVNTNYPNDRIRTELVLKTSHPEVSEMRIPISGFKRQTSQPNLPEKSIGNKPDLEKNVAPRMMNSEPSTSDKKIN